MKRKLKSQEDIEEDRQLALRKAERQLKQEAERRAMYDDWIRDRCEEASQAHGAARELYDDFCIWRQTRSRWPVSIIEWGMAMGKRYERYTSNGRNRYRGIGLKPAPESEIRRVL